MGIGSGSGLISLSTIADFHQRKPINMAARNTEELLSWAEEEIASLLEVVYDYKSVKFAALRKYLLKVWKLNKASFIGVPRRSTIAK